MPDFDGATYDAAMDRERLSTQLERVRDAMLFPPGKRWTIEALWRQCGGTPQSISARIRDLRKDRFGSYNVIRQRVDGGLWEYWIEPQPVPVQRDLFSCGVALA